MAGTIQNKIGVHISFWTWNIGTSNGRGFEICDELWKRNVDVCCFQEETWRGCWARIMLGVLCRKYELWWSGNQEGFVRVAVLVNTELCDNVVEVRKINNSLLQQSLKKWWGGVMCNTPNKVENVKKIYLFAYLSRKLSTHHTSEIIIGMGDNSGHVGRNIDGFHKFHEGFCIGERYQEGRMPLQFCDAEHLCIANTWHSKADMKKIAYGSG